jgi:anti-sigma regulatory factor (Ser/Thr protein kinase)
MAAVMLRAIDAHDASAVAEVRRVARTAALDSGFSDVEAERAAIVATEATTNVVKHGGGGTVIVRLPEADPQGFVDIVTMDRGPGMANVAECMRDGYSSTGTKGEGLGAIARQAALLDIFSSPGQGTVLVARVATALSAHDTTPSRTLSVDGLSLPMRGESVSGDAWWSLPEDGGASILVVDGLGHGHIAETASREAVATFRQYGHEAPAGILDRVHRALIKTRGAAVATARVNAGSGDIRYAGVGNISATVEHPLDPARHLVSVHGTAGHQVRRLQEFAYPWPAEAVLVMHSDGVSAHWSLRNYRGLAARHPLTIAAVLLRDYSRGRDDATVVVAKNAR